MKNAVIAVMLSQKPQNPCAARVLAMTVKIEMLSYAVICFLMCRRRKVGVTEKTESIFRKVSRGTIGAAEDFALVLD